MPCTQKFFPHRLSGGAVLAAVVFFGTPCLRAQQPVFAAATYPRLHRLHAQIDPGPAAPETPQSAPNTPQIKDDLFAGTEKFAKGASDVTEVTMDPDSLDLVGGDGAHRARGMILNVVRTYSYDKTGMYNPADVDEFRHRLEGGDWHCSVHVRDLKSGESTDVCSKRRAPDMVEHAIITTSPKSLTFIHNIKKANGQGSSLDFGGLPSFEMIPDLPLGTSMAILAPEMRAEMRAEFQASAAELQAQMPVLAHGMQSFKFEMPNLDTERMQKEIEKMRQGKQIFKFELTPEQKDQLNDLDHLDHLDHLDLVPAPPTPPAPPSF